MAWTTPTTVNAGDKLTSTLWNNQVAGNLNYLKATVASKVHTAGADITSTSTSFVDVDATNIANSITTVGDDGILLIYMHFSAYGAGVTPIFRIDVDGTAYPVTGQLDGGSNIERPLFLIVSGLAAGEHTVKLQWKASAAGTITLRVSGGYKFYMKLVEVS